MPPTPLHAEPTGRPERQYSLQTLFFLTLAIAVLLGGVLLLRNNGHFHALHSVAAMTALVPIILVCVLNATRLLTGQRLAVASLLMYLTALVVPALRLAGDMVFGWTAFLLSFVGVGMFRNMGHSGEQFWYPIACLTGALVNLLFLYSSVHTLLKPYSKSAMVAASVATLLALAVIIPLGLSGELNGVYIGHGLWITSVLAVALGNRRPL